MLEDERRLIDEVLVALRTNRIAMRNEQLQEKLAVAAERGLKNRSEVIAFVLKGARREQTDPHPPLARKPSSP
jgi:hypothetical protein